MLEKNASTAEPAASGPADTRERAQEDAFDAASFLSLELFDRMPPNAHAVC